jgi:L-alanine-DL-glutamate epimerase-like enolase superfamily enzyme
VIIKNISSLLTVIILIIRLNIQNDYIFINLGGIMKIKNYEIMHCNAGWRDFSFLRIITDEGITGIAEYNECYGSPGLSMIIRKFMDKIIDHDPICHEKIHQFLYASSRQAPGGIAQQAIAAIENALLDIKGKYLNVPVHTLLGGAIRDRLPLYWSHCGTYRISEELSKIMEKPQVKTLEDLKQLGKDVKDAGYKGLKTNIFTFGETPILEMQGFAGKSGWPELNVDNHIIDSLLKQIDALRSGAGNSMGIHLDLNFNFKTEGYLQITRALDDLKLTWFEIDLYHPEGLRRIRDANKTPIASCESLFGIREFRPFFENASMDVAIIDIPWNGIWLGMKIAAMAEAYETNVAPHNFYGNLSTLMSAHFCAAVPNFRVMEIDPDDVPWKDDILTWKPEIIDGDLIVPNQPGWGAELNEEIFKEHPPKFIKE